jgi:tRNA (cytidine56-2'-O)-methyltransferase
LQKIFVLRYGHRDVRDYRVTSHCALVARAFGAEKILIDGDRDGGMLESVNDVCLRWGGNFSVEFIDSWKKTARALKKNGFFIVHLTMYGLPLGKTLAKIRKNKKILIIIGSQKVEKEVYEIADLNVAVGSQPHSEIAALAVALHEIEKGKELLKTFKNAKIRISPNARGKTVKRFD